MVKMGISSTHKNFSTIHVYVGTSDNQSVNAPSNGSANATIDPKAMRALRRWFCVKPTLNNRFQESAISCSPSESDSAAASVEVERPLLPPPDKTALSALASSTLSAAISTSAPAVPAVSTFTLITPNMRCQMDCSRLTIWMRSKAMVTRSRSRTPRRIIRASSVT